MSGGNIHKGQSNLTKIPVVAKHQDWPFWAHSGCVLGDVHCWVIKSGWLWDQRWRGGILRPERLHLEDVNVLFLFLPTRHTPTAYVTAAGAFVKPGLTPWVQEQKGFPEFLTNLNHTLSDALTVIPLSEITSLHWFNTHLTHSMGPRTTEFVLHSVLDK